MSDPAGGEWHGRRSAGRGGGGRERGPSVAERRQARAAETDPEVVLAAAARFLEVRPRSVAEVRRRLRSAGYAAVLVEGAVARLVELGFLDDAAFARAWVESRDRARPRGERALRLELRQKGVGREEADEALGERRDDADEGGRRASADEAAAERLLTRRAAQLGRVPDPRVRRQRAYALLARNGFDPAVCSSVAKRFAADPADPTEGPAELDVDE
jgi:regulatory protein